MSSKNTTRLDRAGVAASCLCAVHCAACAFMPAAFGALGLGFMFSEGAEWIFVGLSVTFATGTQFFTQKKQGTRLSTTILLIGIFGLLAARGLETVSHHEEHHSDSHAVHTVQDAEQVVAITSIAEHTTPPEMHSSHGHSETGETVHLAGTTLGVLAGLFLVLGHILNIRRASRATCCDEGCA